MLCLTGLEPTLAGLVRRRAAAPDALHELRLDALEQLDDEVFAFIARHPHCVVTCRHQDEGGRFAGDRAEQAAILRRAQDAGAAWIDAELSLPLSLRAALFARRGPGRLLASTHLYAPTTALAPPLAALGEAPADGLKLAVAVDDLADLAPLLDLPAPDARPLLRIGMGAAGLLTRVLPQAFGSPWTYVAGEAAQASAAGQLDLACLARWRLPTTERPALYGLLGGPQVMRSPGPEVYNRLFAARGRAARYLPLVSQRPAAALPLLQRLGFVGLSVTMPAKEAAAALCVHQSDRARAAGAANTLALRPDGWWGENTDVVALAELLEGCSGPVLVLGAGGVARAALSLLGPRGRVTARRAGEAQRLAAEFGAGFVPWEARGEEPCAVLIQATPVGSQGEDDPWPAGAPLAGRCVVDAVMRPGGTPLLRRARAAGATAQGGYALWLRQGRAQVRALAGLEVPLEELSELLRGVPGGPSDD